MIEPANGAEPALLMSAIFESSMRRYGSQSGIRHIGSATSAACRASSAARRSSRGVEGHDLRSEGDAGGAGQRREVDEEVRLLFRGERERIGEDEAAFGVGVADLDGQALAAREHVARPEGGAGDGVFDRRDQDAQPDRQPRGEDHVGEAERIGGAAHVLLHEEHAARRLDVEAAGIEADALADDGDLRMRRLAGDDIDEPRLAPRRRRPADGVDHREVRGRAARRRRSPKTRAPWRVASALAAAARSAGPMSLAAVLMRSRASVTPATRRLTAARSTSSGTTRRGASDAIGAVAGEAVGAERKGEAGERRVVETLAEMIRPGREGRRELAGEKRRAVGGIRRAEAEEHRSDPALASRHEQHGAGLGAESGGGDPRGRARLEHRRKHRQPVRGGGVDGHGLRARGGRQQDVGQDRFSDGVCWHGDHGRADPARQSAGGDLTKC